MKYNDKAIGIAIKELRTSKGMSQEVLSGLAGLAREHLAMHESGIRRPTFRTLCKIAFALDIKPSDLVKKIEDGFTEG